VLADGDNVDLVRALRKAVADGDCFPVFSVAEPDFELANFATEELIEIALNIECRADVDDERKNTLRADLAAELGQVVSGRTLFGMLKRHGAHNVTKGADWGKALAAFALAHPTRTRTSTRWPGRPGASSRQLNSPSAPRELHLARRLNSP
jgi:hypothetical protein